MRMAEQVEVKDLTLDLKNFRMPPQPDELHAVQSMIAAKPDRFWALAGSLLDDGYHPTENILLLRDAKDKSKLVVKEGNRRIGALKIVLGHLSKKAFVIPPDVDKKIAGLPKTAKQNIEKIPCVIYEADEASEVDKLVTLTHGKGEQASRDDWNSVAKARHSRDSQGASEPALDLLEKYLTQGKNVTSSEREKWGGEFKLTVLEEALQRLAPRLSLKSAREVADMYPTKHRSEFESLIHAIGSESVGFVDIRNYDFGTTYNFPAPPAAKSASTAVVPAVTAKATGVGAVQGAKAKPARLAKKPLAVATNDPKSVMLALKKFAPKGNNRDKVVTLLNEARRLDLSKHPHAFCFLLRSMFEISAKAYCDDHSADGLLATKAGNDRKLVEVLRDITKHLTKNNQDRVMVKSLHGAMTEMAKPLGILSVTSLNQLVHHKSFSVDETHISTLFNNIFPLLEEMNN